MHLDHKAHDAQGIGISIKKTSALASSCKQSWSCCKVTVSHAQDVNYNNYFLKCILYDYTVTDNY